MSDSPVTRPLYLTEEDVHALIDMRGAIQALEKAFLEQASGDAQNSPRTRARYWGSRLNIMSAGLKSGRFGFKAYPGTNAPTVYHVMLYDADHGLIAIVEARRLSRLRTGAATGVATKGMTKEGAIRLAVIGAGEQARTQIEAVAAVRPVISTLVYARNRERLNAFCTEMSRELACDIKPAANVAECVKNADTVITATDSETPVIEDRWIQGRVHINTIGANAANRMELETTTFARARLVVTDDVDQARAEAGEIIQCAKSGAMSWANVARLADVVSGLATDTDGITIFKSLGAAIEDIAVASAVYDCALAQGRGRFL